MDINELIDFKAETIVFVIEKFEDKYLGQKCLTRDNTEENITKLKDYYNKVDKYFPEKEVKTIIIRDIQKNNELKEVIFKIAELFFEITQLPLLKFIYEEDFNDLTKIKKELENYK